MMMMIMMTRMMMTVKRNKTYSNVLMHSAHNAHYRFHDDALYKSTFYLLTY